MKFDNCMTSKRFGRAAKVGPPAAEHSPQTSCLCIYLISYTVICSLRTLLYESFGIDSSTPSFPPQVLVQAELEKGIETSKVALEQLVQIRSKVALWEQTLARRSHLFADIFCSETRKPSNRNVRRKTARNNGGTTFGREGMSNCRKRI